MENRKVISYLAILVIIGIVINLNSCSKQELSDRPVKGNEEVNISKGDISVYNNVISFKKKVDYIKENPFYKSGETMTDDSAVWYLDAAFNLTHAFTKDAFIDFKTDNFIVTISKTDEMVKLDDVSEAFYEIKDKTLIIYNATDGEQKELYVSHMEIISSTPDEIVLKITSTIGSKNNTTPPDPPFSLWGPFKEGDDWMYGEKLGDCSTGGGVYWGLRDAATEIEDATNTYRYKYIQDEGPWGSAFYTEPSAIATVMVYNNPINKDLFINTNDDVIDNYRDYLLMYQEKDMDNNLVVHTCIPWEEMNFYYHGTQKVIYQIIQENSTVFGVHPSLTFYNCDLVDGVGEGNVEDPDYAYHVATIVYKTRHILGGLIEPTSIEE